MAAQAFPSKLFRRRALDAMSAATLGRLAVTRPPGLAAVVAAALVAVLLLALAAVLIEVASAANVHGVLLPAERIVAVRAPRDGVVAALSVAEGDAVSPGQALFRIADGLHTSADTSLADQQLDLVDRELALLDESVRREIDLAERAAAALTARIAVLENRHDAAGRELAALGRSAALREAQSGRAARLRAGAVAAEHADEAAVRAAVAAAGVAAAEQRVFSLEAEILAAEHSLAVERDNLGAIRLRAGRRRAELAREKLTIAFRTSTPVTSPDAGIVAALTVRAGSTVRAGQQIASVVDPDAPLDAFLYVDAASAVRVEKGQRVELELAGFPREVHGTLPARVVELAGAPVPVTSLPTPIAVTGMVFEVRARLLADVELAPRLRAGSAFRARLIDGREPLYRWIATRMSGRG